HRDPAEERRARPDRPHERLARLRRLPAQAAGDQPRRREVALRGKGGDVHRRRLDRARGDAVGRAGRVPARPRVHVRDRRRTDHRGRRHGGERRREAVRVRVPGLPDEAPRRDRRADALLCGAAEELELRVIDVDAGLVERLLLELARDGAYGETGVWRTGYSPEWVASQNRVAAWMAEAGLEVRQDAVGNVWGTLVGSASGQVVATGSHIDSQTPGG